MSDVLLTIFLVVAGLMVISAVVGGIKDLVRLFKERSRKK